MPINKVDRFSGGVDAYISRRDKVEDDRRKYGQSLLAQKRLDEKEKDAEEKQRIDKMVPAGSGEDVEEIGAGLKAKKRMSDFTSDPRLDPDFPKASESTPGAAKAYGDSLKAKADKADEALNRIKTNASFKAKSDRESGHPPPPSSSSSGKMTPAQARIRMKDLEGKSFGDISQLGEDDQKEYSQLKDYFQGSIPKKKDEPKDGSSLKQGTDDKATVRKKLGLK